MENPRDDIAVVGKLSKDVLFMLADLTDEGIITEIPPEFEKVLDAPDEDVMAASQLFYNIVLYRDEPGKIVKLIDDTDALSDGEKDTLKKVVKKIHDKVDSGNVEMREKCKDLEELGHACMDDINIATEFRPLSEEGKILKLVPSIVIDASTYDLHGNEESINVQMNYKNAMVFAEQLNEKIRSLENEMRAMREKFGSDII